MIYLTSDLYSFSDKLGQTQWNLLWNLLYRCLWPERENSWLLAFMLQYAYPIGTVYSLISRQCDVRLDHHRADDDVQCGRILGCYKRYGCSRQWQFEDDCIFKSASSSYTCINPFPNKPWFLRVCSADLLKTLCEKEKLLVTSNFSSSLSVFYPFGKFPPFSSNLK